MNKLLPEIELKIAACLKIASYFIKACILYCRFLCVYIYLFSHLMICAWDMMYSSKRGITIINHLLQRTNNKTRYIYYVWPKWNIFALTYFTSWVLIVFSLESVMFLTNFINTTFKCDSYVIYAQLFCV